MKKSVLRSYAKLIVKIGANVQKNQDVVIYANVEDAYFVKYLVEESYKAKARSVRVDWAMDELTVLNYKYQKLDDLKVLPEYQLKKLEHDVNTLPAKIFIDSSDPDALNAIDSDKQTEVRRYRGPIIQKYRDQMDNKFQWTIAGIPSEGWAKKVFPNLNKKQAVEALWDAILKVSRAYGDSVENWNNHNENLRNYTEKLNNLHIKKLYYKSKNGTDFSVCLKQESCFLAGGEYTLNKVYYNPNIPTEECFTSPDKYSANGIVYATKPLSVMGKLVSDFAFRFENGKIVEVIANKKEDKDVLEKLISLDEGARQLGEVALVPWSSPINQSNLLFYSTLYDENACCHLAIGRAFNECIKNYQQMSEEELENVDLNKSMIHVDFMIGSEDLEIIAEGFDGKTTTIFKDGNWAI